MSAPVTEAHRELAYAILFATEYGPAGPNETAQLIADSEAKACDQLRAEVAWWKNWHDENEKMEDGIAVKVQATIDGLRAEVERLKAKISNQAYRIRCLEGATNHATGTPLSQANARAERAEAELDGIRALADRRNKRYHVEDTTHQLVAALDQALDIAQAELATERARLDWLEENAGDIHRYNSSKYLWFAHQNLRAAIHTAMKEGAK